MQSTRRAGLGTDAGPLQTLRTLNSRPQHAISYWEALLELQWKSHFDLSAMHAAWCVDQFPDRTQHVAPELRQAASDLAKFGSKLGVPKPRFWNTLLPLVMAGANNAELAERTLIRVLPPAVRDPARVSEFSGLIGAVERAARNQFPNYEREIQLRQEPLQQLWESVGPGLLRLIGNLTETSLIVSLAQVVLVQPTVGGAGYAHLATNRVHIEAVLTNADVALPETLRLAWLLSQLDFERPVYSELINAFDLHRVAGLAMIPPTLLAAADLELCGFSQETVLRAVRLWLADTDDVDAEALSQVLMTWWETYEGSRPQWRTAITGLDRMLSNQFGQQ